ncbi:MAG TPA: GNAT family N-acetyltransferase [Acholeplasmataceae bacterium]|jgi:putative hemolysin|nr:GNAT family N-acetyltransferase [Acholeplasmataceae bacterium]
MSEYEQFVSGDIEIRLTRNLEELKETMRLRYHELLLYYNADNKNSEELFRDEYDELADHLVAVNVKTNEIVGTYRLIHKDLLPAEWKFPTEKEFDISTLKNENIMEISRAVVKKEYRTGSTVILLWRGLMNYAIARGVKYIFGTASFPGIDPLALAHPLSYVYYNHLSPTRLQVPALPNGAHPINLLPKAEVDPTLAKRQLPALVKGYINIGATFSAEAYVDRYFNSVDLFVLVDTEKISSKYIHRFMDK